MSNTDTITNATRALAESVSSIVDLDDETADALNETFTQFQDYLTQKAGGGNDHHASKVADLLVESGRFPDRSQALNYLFTNPRGTATLRLHKSEDSTAMPINLSDVVKNHGVVALCKFMVEKNSTFGASEAELVELASADAARRYPGDSPAFAFTKLYEESRELREAIEIAKSAALQSAVADEIERDAKEAMRELNQIGKARWPSLTPAQRFARAFETNPELAKRAHRRPGPSTSFSHPPPRRCRSSPISLRV
jgi:hypothetical protein